MALDPVQLSLVMLASAVKEARGVLLGCDPELSKEAQLAQLKRILVNDAVDIIVGGVDQSLAQQPHRSVDPFGDVCPVCKGAKTITGATCIRCRGSGKVQQRGAG